MAEIVIHSPLFVDVVLVVVVVVVVQPGRSFKKRNNNERCCITFHQSESCIFIKWRLRLVRRTLKGEKAGKRYNNNVEMGYGNLQKNCG
jgi:hypothetical protein